LDITSIDKEIFSLINAHVGSYKWLDTLVGLLVSDYLIPVSFSLLLLSIWIGWKDDVMRDRNQTGVLLSIFGVITANAIVKIMNLIFFRPRPFDELEVNLLFYMPTDSSFPSNPAAVAFAIATGIFHINKKLAISMYLLSALYGLSRIYAGVCYPTDVIAGMAIGILSVITIRIFFYYMKWIPSLILNQARNFYLA